jgi:nanoRNase/pAp phosphatase (c-di-AMP/oligoRNAs hydrolase)
MLKQEVISALKELLEPAETVLVVVGSDPKYDHMISALALAQSLRKSGKEVTLVSPDELSEKSAGLPAGDTFVQKLGSQNLSVSFPYQPEAVDKVSYHINDEESKFFLVVKPQKGQSPLSVDQVSFDYVGAAADFIFLVGVHQLDSLEHLYHGFEELYDQATVVTIHTFETEIGDYKLDLSGTAAISQSMVNLLTQLDLPVDGDIATTLLAGIEDSTDQLTSVMVTADTFDLVAWLMRSGARRIKKQSQLKKTAKINKEKLVDGEVVVSSKSFSAALSKTKQQAAVAPIDKKIKPHRTSRKKKKSPVPGGLKYQPGESGVGMG